MSRQADETLSIDPAIPSVTGKISRHRWNASVMSKPSVNELLRGSTKSYKPSIVTSAALISLVNASRRGSRAHPNVRIPIEYATDTDVDVTCMYAPRVGSLAAAFSTYGHRSWFRHDDTCRRSLARNGASTASVLWN